MENKVMEMTPIHDSTRMVTIHEEKKDEKKVEDIKLPEPEQMTRKQKENYMTNLKNRIDDTIGYYYWKKYIASAFWSNLSTPINLTITLLTAMMTAQATTSNLLSDRAYYNISVANLLISVLNTFFRPHGKVSSNVESLTKWNALGCKFELINAISSYTNENLDHKIREYTNLLMAINDLRQSESPENVNFLTDLIHLISLKCCLKDKYMWSFLDVRRKTSFSGSNDIRSPTQSSLNVQNPTSPHNRT